MKASVNVSSTEIKRLFTSTIKNGGFSERMVADCLSKLLSRVEKDYPHLLRGIYMTSHRKYQQYLHRQRQEQAERNKQTLNDIYGGNV